MQLNEKTAQELAEYFNTLNEIQLKNTSFVPHATSIISENKPIYNIDLSTRTIEAPEEIIIEKDHDAEIIYFKVPRYFDNMDLSNTTCVIQYENANGEPYFYAVPYFDIDTLNYIDVDEGIYEPMMLFPWVLSGILTKASGTVKFSIRFYILKDNGKELFYSLNTLPSQMTITANNFEYPEDVDDDVLKAPSIEQLLAAATIMASEGSLYWTVL